jgi:hypothetical protein
MFLTRTFVEGGFHLCKGLSKRLESSVHLDDLWWESAFNANVADVLDACQHRVGL